MTSAPRWISDGAIDRLREAAEAPDLSGTKYELVGLLARGGMGAIHLARDTELDRRVALKVLSVPSSDPGLSQRMIREARVLARLEHPGIVPVHDAGVLPDGRIFYVMKHVRGRSLDDHPVLRAPLADRLRVMEKICEAVAFAHDRGIVHRDLKPENVMVGEFGEVLVMDWGIAKILEEARSPDGPVAASFVAGTEANEKRGISAPHETLNPTDAARSGGGDLRPSSDVEAAGRSSSERRGAEVAPPALLDLVTPPQLSTPHDQTGGAVVDEAGQPHRAPGSGDPAASAALSDEDSRWQHTEGATTVPAAFTGHGSVLGTPAWMAPEQARGETGRIDARADVYALGAILHFLLVREPPSDARSPAEAIARFESGATGSPRRKDPSLPKALDSICRKAMAQAPEARYALAGDLNRDVALYLAGLRPRAHREGLLERAGRLERTYRTAILLVLAYLAMRATLILWLGR